MLKKHLLNQETKPLNVVEDNNIDSFDKGLDEIHIGPMKNLTFESTEEINDSVPMHKPTPAIVNPIDSASVPDAGIGLSSFSNKPLRGIVDPVQAMSASAFDEENNKDKANDPKPDTNFSNRVSSGLSNIASLDRDITGRYIDSDDKTSNIENRINKPIPRSVVIGNDVNNPTPTDNNNE